jgi:hypothetical protein
MRRTVIGCVGTAALISAAVIVFAHNRSDSAGSSKLADGRPSLQQIRLTEKRALAGSTEGTDDLIEYYASCHRRNGYNDRVEKLCRRRFEYWIRIGLENGSPVAQQRQTSSLLLSDNCYDIYRAEYLYNQFKHSFRSNDTFLKSVLIEISEKKKKCAWQIPS